MAGGLYRLGLFTARHKWVVLGVWVVLVAAVVAASHASGSNTSNNLDLPGTDSQAATDLLAAKFPPQQNGSNPLVFYTKTGKVTDASNKQAIEASYATVKKLPHVASAVDPFGQQGAAQVSKDKQTAFIPVLLDVGGSDLTQEIAESVLRAGNPGRRAGMQVAVGGSVGGELSEPTTESSELIGLIAAMIILAFTFGTLVAMGLPIVSAVCGLIAGLTLIVLLGHVVTVPTIAPTLATMLGLGVGIDYALFLVSRHRANRKDGMGVQESVAMAVATSGTAIVFAGSTVVIALITLLVAGIPLVTSLGYSSAIAVVTAVLAAITFLPALLALVGTHLESLRVPHFMRPKPKPPDRGFWGAWARFVTGHPWISAAACVALLVPLIIPFASLNLGQEDIGATPKDTTERQAYDLIAAGFGPGYNGPLLIAVSLGTPAQPSTTFINQKTQAQSLQKQLEAEQKSGNESKQNLTNQSNSLTSQQASLEQQQKELTAEQASTEQQAKVLQSQQASIKEKRSRLQNQQTTVLGQLNSLGAQAKAVVREGATLAKKSAAVSKKLARNHAEEKKVLARLQHATTPSERAHLEAQLRRLQRQQAALQKQLNTLLQQDHALRKQASSIVNESAALRREEQSIATETIALADQGAALAKDAIALVQQKEKLIQQASNLEVEAANLQTQAANLNTQKVTLQGQQQQAQTQQQQAEQLQTELTNELTQAGGDERGTDPRLVNLQNAMSATQGVAVVSPPKINKSGDAAIYNVISTTNPADTATADLVKTLRTYTIPQATRGTNLQAYVGGQTASYVDLATAISNKLILVIFCVIALGFLVLMTAFRSVLVAGQAALVNVLANTAAFGVVTACFQWGWGLGIVGIDTSSSGVPIASYVPLIMFAVLFGLSMDYQVFLVSQIEHHRAQGEDDRHAVAAGLATGARVIVAAALIMMSVFASFILNGDPTVKQFGVGLSVGVFLAATCVLTLSPALLVLSGHGSWWLPEWAERFLPHIDIEGAGLAPKPEAPGVEAPPVGASS